MNVVMTATPGIPQSWKILSPKRVPPHDVSLKTVRNQGLKGRAVNILVVLGVRAHPLSHTQSV